MPKQCTCLHPTLRAGRRETICISCGGVARGPLREDKIRLSEWHTPATDYPRTQVGEAAVKTTYYPRRTYHCYMQRGYEYFVASKRLTITHLEIGGKTWMVDDPPHWWAMEEHAAAFHGHVVCAGLGLGLMIHTLTANPEVTRITVIERERDVIDLISPLVPRHKLDIVQCDFYEVDPLNFEPANGVLFDLYVGDGRELLGPGIEVATDILLRWARAGDDDFVVRVHGLPNPLVGDAARAVIETLEHHNLQVLPRGER